MIPHSAYHFFARTNKHSNAPIAVNLDPEYPLCPILFNAAEHIAREKDTSPLNRRQNMIPEFVPHQKTNLVKVVRGNRANNLSARAGPEENDTTRHEHQKNSNCYELTFAHSFSFIMIQEERYARLAVNHLHDPPPLSHLHRTFSRASLEPEDPPSLGAIEGRRVLLSRGTVLEWGRAGGAATSGHCGNSPALVFNPEGWQTVAGGRSGAKGVSDHRIDASRNQRNPKGCQKVTEGSVATLSPSAVPATQPP